MKKQADGDGGMPLENRHEKGMEQANAQAGMQVTELALDKSANSGEIHDKVGDRPDFRVVQPEVDKEGKIVYKDVGAIWKNMSKAGNEFYTMKIGKLRLLVFKNTLKQ